MDRLVSILDLRTIILVSTIVYAACSILVIQLWRQNRKRFDGLGFIALNYVLQTTGLVALVGRGLIPEGVSIFFTNSLMVLGAILGYYGFSRFFGRPERMILWIVLLVAFIAAQAYWYYVEPSLMWRKINSSIILMFAGLLTTYFLWHMTGQPGRQFTRVIGWVHIAYALFFGARTLVVLYESRVTGGFFDPNSREAALGLFYPPLFVIMTYAVSLMINHRLNWEAEQASAQIKVLSGLLPICAHCKKVRDDTGYWNQIETYISLHSEADFSHGFCPECERTYYPESSPNDG